MRCEFLCILRYIFYVGYVKKSFMRSGLYVKLSPDSFT